jgi:C1A family cysteine protease
MEPEDIEFCFGHKPEPLDPRDYILKIDSGTDIKPIDLSEKFSSIKYQDKISSCTAFATTSMVEYVRSVQKLKTWDASPLFTYYASRKLTNNTNNDSGAYVRDALKSVVQFGVTKEENWPYDITKFSEEPPLSAWQDAEKHQALVYYKVEQTKENVLGCLSQGFPFVFGARIYDSFIKTQMGVLVHNRVPMPDITTEKLIGSHCMTAVGFIEENNSFYIKVRNSWGKLAGLSGYHFIPLDYILDPNLCVDFWTIRLEESNPEDIIPPEPQKPEPVVPIVTITTPTVVEEPKVVDSLWKNPATYFIIAFGLAAILFAFLK